MRALALRAQLCYTPPSAQPLTTARLISVAAPDQSNIAARIKKLLALSNNNSDVHEAAAALAKAQELMLQYRIDRVGVEASSESRDIIEMILHGEGCGGTRIATWKLNIARHISESNGCTTYYTIGSSIKGVGRESDLQIVKYLFDYVEAQVETLCKAASKLQRDTIPGWNKSEGRIYANNFKLGAASTIGVRLEQSIKKVKEAQYKLASDNNDVTALVRLDAAFSSLEAHRKEAEGFLKARHPGMMTIKKRYIPNADGWRDGKLAGEHIDLDKTKRNRIP